MIADISKWQARFTGNPNSLADQWNPQFWLVDRIDFDAAMLGAGAPSGFIFRLGDGVNKDPCFDRFVAEAERRGVAWGFYHYFRPNRDAVEQAQLCRQWCPGRPPLGAWGDLESDSGYAGLALFERCDAYLLALDGAFGMLAGVYSGAWWLDPRITVARQQTWSARPGWWAGYPSLIVPAGWRGTERPYVLHQFTDRHPWPGLERAADANRFAPGWDVDRLRELFAPAPTPGDVGQMAERVRWLAEHIITEIG